MYPTESLWKSDCVMIIKASSDDIHFYKGDDTQGTAMNTLVTSTYAVFTYLQIGAIVIAPLQERNEVQGDS